MCECLLQDHVNYKCIKVNTIIHIGVKMNLCIQEVKRNNSETCIVINKHNLLTQRNDLSHYVLKNYILYSTFVLRIASSLYNMCRKAGNRLGNNGPYESLTHPRTSKL